MLWVNGRELFDFSVNDIVFREDRRGWGLIFSAEGCLWGRKMGVGEEMLQVVVVEREREREQ